MTSPESPAVSPPGWIPTLEAGVHSVIGNVREHNEDSYYVPGCPPVSRYNTVNSSGSFDPTVEVKPVPGPDYLFVVADGMGGQLAGEQASQMAVDIIPQQIASRLTEAGGVNADRKTVRQIIKDSMAKANEDILNMANIGPDYINMGTTCVLAMVQRESQRVYLAGLGDSRAYLVRAGQIDQITTDHSLAEALCKAGTIKREDVAKHKFSHVLYLYLGSRDAKEGPETVYELDLAPGDRLILASDGLTGVVEDDVLAKVVTEGVKPQKTAEELVKMALDNHSKDNITCAIIHVN